MHCSSLKIFLLCSDILALVCDCIFFSPFYLCDMCTMENKCCNEVILFIAPGAVLLVWSTVFPRLHPGSQNDLNLGDYKP